MTKPNILPYLSVKKPEPTGNEAVRFRRKLAVPISPANPLYASFFDTSRVNVFSQSVAAENRRLARLANNQKFQKISQINIEGLTLKQIIDSKQIIDLEKIVDSDIKRKTLLKKFIKFYQGNENILAKFGVTGTLLSHDIKDFNSFIDDYGKLLASTNISFEEGDRFIKKYAADSKICRIINAIIQYIKGKNGFYKNRNEWHLRFCYTQSERDYDEVIFDMKIYLENDGQHIILTQDISKKEQLIKISTAIIEKFKEISGHRFLITDQTISLLIDERVNDWYRSYKDAKEKESHINVLIKTYTERPKAPSANNAAGDPPVATTDNPSTTDTTYYTLKKVLYEIRDRKKALIREIRTSGYDIKNTLSDVPADDSAAIDSLGYDFAITKGKAEYATIQAVSKNQISEDLSFLDDEPLDLKKAREVLDNPKTKWCGVGGILEKFKLLASGSWPDKLITEMETEGSKLQRTKNEFPVPDMLAIPDTLVTEKETEKFLLKALHENPWYDNKAIIEAEKEPAALTEERNKLKKAQQKYYSHYKDKDNSDNDLSKLALSRRSINELLETIMQISRPDGKSVFMRSDELAKIDDKEYAAKSDGKQVLWADSLSYFNAFNSLPDEVKNTWITISKNPGAIVKYIQTRIDWKRKKTFFGLRSTKNKFEIKTDISGRTATEWFIHIATENLPTDFKWNSRENYLRVQKEGVGGIVVITGILDEPNTTQYLSSINPDSWEAIVMAFRNFIDTCNDFTNAYYKYYDDYLIKQLERDFAKEKQAALILKNSLEDLRKYALTKARINFILHWSSPGKFRPTGVRYITNAIKPDNDPWADFVEQLQPGKDYNPMERKVQIDYFTFQRNGYYTQEGISMAAYIQLLERDSVKGMRVAIFPVLNEYGDEIQQLRRAVINPEASYQPHPIAKLPQISFIEDHTVGITWDGFCLGELSHSENLAAGESKTITISKITNMKQRLTESLGKENVAEMKSSASVEEKLSEELSNKVSYEKEQKQKIEDNKLNEKKQDTSLTDTRNQVSDIALEIKALGIGKLGGETSFSNKITKDRGSTIKNEELMRDSLNTTSDYATKQGRESQSKDLREKMQKATTDTSQLNKVTINKTSEKESSESTTASEKIEIQNNNVGKTLSYYFFQLQNIYRMQESVNDVHIVVSPPYEIIAKSNIRDIRVFHITDLPNIYKELGGGENAAIISLLAYTYAFDNYFHSIGADSDDRGGLLASNHRSQLENIKTEIDEIVTAKFGDPTMAVKKINMMLHALPFEFASMSNATKEGELVAAVNSGGFYMDTELGKHMATEPYLEKRRDIETNLKQAEVEHLKAQTKAGVFYPTLILL